MYLMTLLISELRLLLGISNRSVWRILKYGTNSNTGVVFFADVNECVTGWNRCENSTVCVNTPGSYKCQCKDGYYSDTGNAKKCFGKLLRPTIGFDIPMIIELVWLTCSFIFKFMKRYFVMVLQLSFISESCFKLLLNNEIHVK